MSRRRARQARFGFALRLHEYPALVRRLRRAHYWREMKNPPTVIPEEDWI